MRYVIPGLLCGLLYCATAQAETKINVLALNGHNITELADQLRLANADSITLDTNLPLDNMTTPKKATKKKKHAKKKLAQSEQTTTEKIKPILDQVTPDDKSVLEDKIKHQNAATYNPLSIILFNPTYILPYYYTASPDNRVYINNTPNNQKIMRNEFKAQLSVVVPVIPHLFHYPNLSLDLAYTQLNYWQFYAASQYFRETNYEPEIFVEDRFHRNWLFRAGLDHQSNGRGGELERSWNRAVGTVQFSGNNWLVGVKAWALLFQDDSSNLHNPDIAKYLGYENVLFAYKIKDATLSLQLQNLESGLRRGFVEATVSYPVLKHISLYAQYFNGYGQSLIEYNHRTQGAGIGIAFNDWI